MSDKPTEDKPADDLVDTKPGGEVELAEDDLNQVSGGGKTHVSDAFKWQKSF